MSRTKYVTIGWLAGAVLFATGNSDAAALYLQGYRIADPAQEADLARSAAPPSVAGDAQVLVLGSKGYEVQAAGKNGFVCIVERSWAVDFDDKDFFNPKIRSPNCFNAVAAKTVLAAYLERTKWVLAGQSMGDMREKSKTAIASGAWTPAAGAMCYMMSKQGHLSDSDGHWHPHLMFFVTNEPASWGANLAGSPVIAARGPMSTSTTFMVPVESWSDGSRDTEPMH